MRRGARLVAGLTLVGVALPSVTAGASDDEDQVTLASEATKAPAVAAGSYGSTVPKLDDEAFFAVGRTIEGSTLWVGETVVSTPRRLGYLGVRALTGPEDRDMCESASAELDTYEERPLITVLMPIDAQACREDELTVGSRQFEGDGSIEAGTPMQMLVWEEPPPTDRSLLPPPVSKVKWKGTPLPAKGTATTGTTFADAPDLTGSRWQVHVDPVTLGLIRVELDWGEHVEVSLEYDGAEYREYLPIEAELITPLGGHATWADTIDGPSFEDVNLSYPGIDGGVASPTISWRNREAGSENNAAFPGVYYVNLHMRQDKAPKKGADITVGVEVVKDREPSSPYSVKADPVPDLGGHGAFSAAQAAAEEQARESDREESSGSGSGDTPWPVVGLLFGGSAVMAVAGGLALGRWRRSGVPA